MDCRNDDRYKKLVDTKVIEDQPYCHRCYKKVDEWEQYVDSSSSSNEWGYDIVQACPHCGSLCWEPSWFSFFVPFFLAWFGVYPLIGMEVGFVGFLVWIAIFVSCYIPFCAIEKHNFKKTMIEAEKYG